MYKKGKNKKNILIHKHNRMIYKLLIISIKLNNLTLKAKFQLVNKIIRSDHLYFFLFKKHIF